MALGSMPRSGVIVSSPTALYTASEVARACGVSLTTVTGWIRDGILEAWKQPQPGRLKGYRWRIPRRALLRLASRAPEKVWSNRR